MQVVHEFRITVGSLKEKEGGKGRGKGWKTDGQKTNMTVNNEYKLL